MVNSLFLFWIESAICLLAAWGLYLAFRKRISLLLRKWYLLSAPVLGMVIPLLDYSLPSGAVMFSGIPAQLTRWIDLMPGGTVRVTGLGILGLAYFLVTAILLFRLGDRLAEGLPASDSLAEVLFVEGGLSLFWFQPALLLFRNELKKTNDIIQTSKSSGQWPAATLLFSSFGVWILLSWLFSANQICKAPQWNTLESRVNEWQARLESPIFQLGTPRQEQVWLGWGGYQTPLVPLSQDTLTRFALRMLSPFELFSMYDQDWVWKKDGWAMDPMSVEALAVFPFQASPVQLSSLAEIRVFLGAHRYATEMTLIVKTRDGQQKEWLGVIGISEKERVYGFEDVLQSWGVEMPLLYFKPGNNGRPVGELLPHSPYSLVWGGIKLPLDFQANPNVYGAHAVYDLEEFKGLVAGPIRFYSGDSLLTAETVRVTLMDDYSGPKNFFAGLKKISQEGGDVLLEMEPDDLRPATTWTIIATLPGGVEVNAVNLEIRDTDTAYDPPLRAPRLQRPDSLFSFQLITRYGMPSLMKIDTTQARNRKILDMYRGNPAYRIVHIPRFETCDRLVQAPDQVLSLLWEEELPLDSIFLCDHLPELPYHLLDSLFLEWGALYAAPDSKVYTLEEFRAQMGSRMKLVSNARLEIHSFVLYVYQEGRPMHARWFDRESIRAWKMDSLSGWFQPRTTLFSDQMVVADEHGRLFSVPMAFAFHIGKPERDIRWKVAVERVESGEAGEPELLEDGQTLNFRSYQLSDLISILAVHPKSRMEFRGLKNDPVLNVRITANGPLPKRAKEFMLNELQKQFRFEFSYERLARLNWRLHLKDPDMLNRAQYAGGQPPEDHIRIFDWEGTHVLTGVTLNELALHLEHRFDEIVEWFPNAFMEDRYTFTLDCSSLASVQFQLETEYGIVFQRMDTLWQGMVVRFME